MAALDTALSLTSSHFLSPPKFTTFPKSPSSLTLHISSFNSRLSLKSPFYPHKKLERFEIFSAVEEITVEETEEDETQKGNLKKKLFVVNLPWSYSVVDIKNVFGECGTVSDVEIIKQKNGKSRGFAFITMESGEEAQAVIDKFDSYELLGRIIRVEFAKRLKKPKILPVSGPQPGETRHKLYVSNLAWKVRSSNLKEFFNADHNPVSARVVFDSPTGRSSGYGFVSFATKEEAESALSSLEGKEILGRPVRLKFSEASDGKEEEAISEEPLSS